MTKIRQSHVSWEGQPRRHQRGSRKKKSHIGENLPKFSEVLMVCFPRCLTGIPGSRNASDGCVSRTTECVGLSAPALCVWGCLLSLPGVGQPQLPTRRVSTATGTLAPATATALTAAPPSLEGSHQRPPSIPKGSPASCPAKSHQLQGERDVLQEAPARFAETTGAVFRTRAAFEMDRQNKLLEEAELTSERALFW